MNGALSGIKVLDFTEVIAGPLAAQMLADMGASVTKIEPPIGDFSRLTNTIAHNESRGFIGVNRGKRSAVVDLKTPEGQAIIHRAVLDTDVVLANYRPGVAKRLGVDYQTLSALNPRLIYAENTAFGSRGPYASRAGYDLVAQAMTGIVAYESQETPSTPHSITTASVTDLGAAFSMAYAIAAALYQRQTTGRGQLIETSLFAAGIAFQYRPLLSVEVIDKAERETLLAQREEDRKAGLFVGEPVLRPGAQRSSTATNPYYRIYRTRDSFMVVACLNNRLRRLAAGVLGVEDSRLKTNEFDSTALSIEDAEVLNGRIREAFLSRSTDDWCQAFDSAGVPCGPVRISEEVYDDPQVAAQNLMLELDHPVFGPIRMPNLPIRMSGADTGAQTAAPALGQHTSEFLAELGYTNADIDTLKTAGVIKLWQ